jgi:hypothetical protein
MIRAGSLQTAVAAPLRRAAIAACLAALAGLPCLARASFDTDRGWQELNSGNDARARWLFEQALKQDPCDAKSLEGLERSGGPALNYKKRCPDAAAAAAQGQAGGTRDAFPDTGPVPTEQASPAGSGADASHGVDASAPASAGAVSPSAAVSVHRLASWIKARWALGLGLALALWALFVVPGRVARVWKGRGAKGSGDGSKRDLWLPPSLVRLVAQQDAASRAENAAPAQPIEVRLAAPDKAGVASPPAAGAQLSSTEALNRPFGPQESVRLTLRAGGEEVFLTDKKFYWCGSRALPGFFKRKSSPVTVAVPFEQITGVAWAKPEGGDMLIIGTVFAGDFGLHASLFGAVPLRSLAQALSDAMDHKS